jgi:hypothetical protein
MRQLGKLPIRGMYEFNVMDAIGEAARSSVVGRVPVVNYPTIYGLSSLRRCLLGLQVNKMLTVYEKL